MNIAAPCFSHLSTIPLATLAVFEFFSKTADSSFFAFSAEKLPSTRKPDSSKMQFVEQHQELNAGSELVQFAMHLLLISCLKISGTMQHSIASLAVFGHVVQFFSSIPTRSSGLASDTWDWSGLMTTSVCVKKLSSTYWGCKTKQSSYGEFHFRFDRVSGFDSRCSSENICRDSFFQKKLDENRKKAGS